MPAVYPDATVLIALGSEGRLRLLSGFAAPPIVLPAVRAEVTTDPAATAVDRWLDTDPARAGSPPQTTGIEQAQAVLGTDSVDGDVELIAAVLAGRDRDADVAVVSDDRTVRTTAAGFGATVTGTIGVLVRAVADGTLDEPTAIALVRDLDTHGLHMTAELRATAEELIADAAPDGEE